MDRKSFDGDLITRYRDKENITQSKFAKRLNDRLKEKGVEGKKYRDTTISMWENGNREPQNLAVIKVIANMIGVSLDELCCNVSNEKGEIEAMEKEPKKKTGIDIFIEEIKQVVRKEEYSNEIALFMSGIVLPDSFYENFECCFDTLTSEFWMFQPFEISDYDDISHLCSYEQGIDSINEFLDAKLIDEKEFNSIMCDKIIEQMIWHKWSADNLYDYLYNRFDEGALSYFDCFLPNDLDEIYGDMIEFKWKPLEVLSKHYTTNGVLFRVRQTISCNAELFKQLFVDYAKVMFGDVASINQKTVEELFANEN